MKSQREIYEALLDGKTLSIEVTSGLLLVRLNKAGEQETCIDNELDWKKDSVLFKHLDQWSIYSPPRIPMTLECDVEWVIEEFINQNGTHSDVIFPDNFKYDQLKPFIGKRTKMTLVEILENDNESK